MAICDWECSQNPILESTPIVRAFWSQRWEELQTEAEVETKEKEEES